MCEMVPVEECEDVYKEIPFLVDDEECDIVMENVCKMEKSVSCRTVEKAAWKVNISQVSSFAISNRGQLMVKVSTWLTRAINGLTRVSS